VAIYHLHVKNIGRSEGRSAVAAAAYRAGETLPNEAEERESAFGGRRDVVLAEIILPAGAPAWMADRARLWNAAEAAEKRKDARLAKEIEFALPRELPSAMWAEVARAMADAYTQRGHVVDLAIHDGSGDNPHVHLMLATRAVTAEGFGGKLRAADGKMFVTEARTLWAKIANAALGKVGAGVQIDARSHAARAIGEPPTRHRGPDPEERRARRSAREEGRMGNVDRDQPPPDGIDPEREYPVPDPDGRPISQPELDEAQARMLREVERPAPEVRQPPRPDRVAAAERNDARAAVDRQNELPADRPTASFNRIAPHEDELDWLRQAPTQKPPEVGKSPEVDELDWLRDDLRQLSDPAPQWRRDRDRDR
jgi:ATP-dependent exoDNAse (exonuclease V) alpha subunit